MLEYLCRPSGLLTLMFSCEYCKTFKSTYFEKHLRTTTSCFMKKKRHQPKSTVNNSSKKKFKSMEIYGLFIKRQTSGTSSDNEWQWSDNDWQRVTGNWWRVVQRMATSDNEWYNEWQQVTMSGTASGN